jgi:hypothetical protein
MKTTLRLEDVPALLAELKRDRFYGRISFEFHAGELRLLRKEETQVINDGGTEREQHTYRRY